MSEYPYRVADTDAAEILANASGRDIIRGTNERVLIGVVMLLTGGSANPSTVKHHIDRIKKEAEG